MKCIRKAMVNTTKKRVIQGTHIVLTLIVSLFVITGPVMGEIIYMTNGNAIVGRIISQSPDYITARENGKSFRLKKREILRISFATTENEENVIRLKNDIDEMLDWQKELDRVLEMRRKEELAKEEERNIRSEQEVGFFTDELLELKRRKKRGAFYRSLAFPGWGQDFKDQNWKAISLVSLAIFSAAFAKYSLTEYGKLSDSYNESNVSYIYFLYWRHNLALGYYTYSNSVELRNSMSNNVRTGNIFIGSVAIIYLISLIDAYYSDVDMGLENEFVSQKKEPGEGHWDIAVSRQPVAKGSNGEQDINSVYAIRYSMFF